MTIVENTLVDPPPLWAAVEELAIGGDEARPETLFGYVADVAVDQAGRIYVLDQHAQQVRVFDPEGAHERTIGGPGEGPGELSRFTATLLVTGDTLGVADWGRQRVHRFLLDGTFLDAPSFPGPQGARSWWAKGGDGSVYFRSLARTVTEGGRWSGVDALHRVGSGWTEPVEVQPFTYAETDLGGPGNPLLPLIVNAPIWAVASDGSRVWTTLEETQLYLVGPDGAERRVRSRSWTRRAPSQGEREQLLELAGEKMRMLGGSADAVNQVPVAYPELLPALTGLVASSDGTVWVQRMGTAAAVHPMALNTPDPPNGWGGRVWDVVDVGGRLLGSVEVPSSFRPLRIRYGAVYGVRRDELGVERVLRLRLDESSRP